MRIRGSHIAHIIIATVIGSAAAVAGYRSAQPEGHDHAHDDHEHAQETGAPEHMQVDPAAAMEAWMKAMTPGEQHEYLKQFEGTWETTTRVWWDPSGAPTESHGSTTYTMILGGRFLRQDYSGTFDMPGPDGQMQSMPFSGMGLSGYNNTRKRFTAMWVDNFTTAILTMHGSLSPDGKTLTMFGQMDEPTTGEIGKTVKWVTRVESENKHVFEAWEVQYGEPFKVFEIEYVRKP